MFYPISASLPVSSPKIRFAGKKKTNINHHEVYGSEVLKSVNRPHTTINCQPLRIEG